MRRGTWHRAGHRAGQDSVQVTVQGIEHGMALKRAERHRERTAENGAGEESRAKEKPPTTGGPAASGERRARSVAPEPVVLSELLFGYVACASPRDGAMRRHPSGAVIAGRRQLSNGIAQPERTPCASVGFVCMVCIGLFRFDVQGSG